MPSAGGVCTQTHRLAAGSPRWFHVSTQGRFWSVTKSARLLVIDFFACQLGDNFLAREGDRRTVTAMLMCCSRREDIKGEART